MWWESELEALDSSRSWAEDLSENEIGTEGLDKLFQD